MSSPIPPEPEPAASAAPADPVPSRRRAFVDLTPLRTSPAFARLWIGSAISGIGANLTVVAVGLQVYDITHDTFAVSLVGGIALVPLIVAGLWGGMLADAFDRRTVAIVSATAGWLTVIGLVVLAAVDQGLGDRVAVWPLYVLTTINSVAATINQATRASITPRLLPPSPAAHDATRPGLRSLREGIAFLRRAPNIRAGFLVDILAMGLGRPHVLFPAVGALVIGGGAVTVGILTASGAVGTFLTALLSGSVGHVRWQGRAIVSSVMVYGGFVAAFGILVLVLQTGSFGPVGESFTEVNPVALLIGAIAMAGTGAADEVSAIFRATMLQVALWFPPLLGGLVIVAAVGIIGRLRGGLRDYDALAPRP